MKTKHLIRASLIGLALSLGFTSCDDDNEWSWKDEGSKVEMSRDRAFVLNEGSYGMNNSNLGYFSFNGDIAYEGDLFEAQNGRKIGDTGQDIISHNGNLYLVVSGSKYVARLDGVGKETARLSFADNPVLGDPRYVAASGGFIYVTSYGGLVNKIDAATLELIASANVENNPEQIVVSGGKVYCVNSGWGAGNTLSVIDEKTFDKVENVTIMPNPQRLVGAGDKLIIQGTGADFYTPRVDIYDIRTKQSKTIGRGSSMAVSGGKVIVADASTDYSVYPYGGSTKVYSYDLKTGTIDENPLKGVPDEMKNATAYGVSANPYTGHVYVCTTNFIWGNGTVYHFDAKGNYVGKVSSNGQNPSKVVFLY